MNVRAAEPSDLEWLAQRTGWVFTANARGLAAIDRLGVTRGCVGYDEWTPSSVRAHMAVDTPIAWRALLKLAFSYPFVECDKTLLLAVINSDNVRSNTLVRRFGFKEVHRVIGGWSKGVDLVMYQMHRDACRFLGRERKAA
jgi:hypothetical protein